MFFPLISAEITFFDQGDAFIMGSSSGSSSTGGVIEAVGGTIQGSCSYKWNCTNWGECLQSGKQTRNCINIGTCPSTYKAPEVEQNCTFYISSEAETEKIIANAIKNEDGFNNKIFLYCVIALIVGFVIFYLKRNYFKKQTQKVT